MTSLALEPTREHTRPGTRIVRRFPRAATIALVLLALITGGLSTQLVGAGSASAMTLAAGASPTHPFSDPVWYPLRGSYATMDCASSNPGCTGAKRHKDDSMTILSRHYIGKKPIYVAQRVYAAGAGILHIGANVGDRCQYPSSLGTWIWIDHGAGVVSRYGHLTGIIKGIRNGEYVTPNTVIGYTGHSGESTRGDCNRATHYLNFQIEHNGLYGSTVRLSSLHVCNGTRAMSWPKAIRSSASTWQKIPQKAVLNNAGQSATACVSPVWAHSPYNTTSSLRGRRGSATVSWRRAPVSAHVNYVQVVVQLYHPHNHSWSFVSRRTMKVVGTMGTHVTVKRLLHPRTYRANVSFHNSGGWSRQSKMRNVRIS